MSYAIYDADGWVGDLSTNAGLDLLHGHLKKHGGKLLKELVADGTVEVSDDLKAEIKALPAGAGPLEGILSRLTALVDKADTVVIITDGAGIGDAEKALRLEKPPKQTERLQSKLEAAMADAMDDGLKKAFAVVKGRIYGSKQNAVASKVLTSPSDILADADLWQEIREILLGKMQGASLDIARQVLDWNAKLGLAIDMDKINTVALEYTRNYSNEWWTELEESTREGLREALTTWHEGGLGTRGFPDLVNAIEPYFGSARAERIAMTETTRIFDESNRFAELAAGVGQQKWYTSMDTKVCDICEPLNGKVFNIEDGPYPVEDTHIGCRCMRIGVARAL